ncbi:MAG: DUF4149 domain-containing protein [Planctomycetes bacterium]|nr:DUF4149 domain-containing protein [Planctomycetota bacterium]
MKDVARTVDLLALAFALGATLWFFFVQSPLLFKQMGRAKFVPLQMRLTKVLFRSLSVAVALMSAATVFHHAAVPSMPVCSAVAGLVGVLVNSFVVIPRALKAGAASMQDGHSCGGECAMTAFASEGGGNTTRFWHRMVVALVVVMLGGLLPHAYAIASG